MVQLAQAGRSQQEIAHETGLSQGTVSVHLRAWQCATGVTLPRKPRPTTRRVGKWERIRREPYPPMQVTDFLRGGQWWC
jgi:DNA-binding transcriptional ArsR family regulator